MKKTLFGTDGIRSRVGISPLTMHELPILGQALAQWAQEKYGAHARMLLISDTRSSTDFIKAALQTGLLLSSLRIYDGGIMPTPAAYVFTYKQKQFDCSIVISASHNPYADNGIKIMDSQHGKISDHDQEIITSLFIKNISSPNLYNNYGQIARWQEGQKAYSTFVINYFKTDFLRTKTIVLDCAHGATSFLAPFIFSHCGAHVIALNNRPNGTNINQECGALFPLGLQKAMQFYNADAGFAFDGDGDRLIAIAKNGDIKDGDDILVLLLDHPLYANSQAVVGTIMSNSGLEAKLKLQGRALIRTAVGDKHIAHALSSYRLMLGAEPSGHVIMSDYMNTGDGIFTALRLLEAITVHNNWNMISFKRYPQIHLTLSVSTKKDLTSGTLARIITCHERQLVNGRLIVRYSGTENVLRLMLEDTNEEHARQIGLSLKKQLHSYL